MNQVIKQTAVTIGQFSSLLEFNKLLAKILHTSVYAYLPELKLLSNQQYGFRRK